MKSISKTLLAMAAISVAGITARGAAIEISDFDIDPGGEYVATVNIDPQGAQMFEYKGVQFELTGLPSGLEIDLTSSEALAGYELEGYSYEGGCRLMVYTRGGAAVSTTGNISRLSFRAAEDAKAGLYPIKIENVDFSTPLGDDRGEQGGSFTVTINEKEEPGPGPGPGPGPEPGPEPEEPNVPSTPIPDGTWGNDNGTWVSTLRIREGDLLTMGVNDPEGGYEDGWQFSWTAPDSQEIGTEPVIETPALLYGAAAQAGKQQAISQNVYTVSVLNYDEDGEIFWQDYLQTAQVSVYKRPQIPTQLLRKGDGTSHTLVVMMTPLGNQEILDLGYSYTYGYTDKAGAMHELATTEKRYTHTTGEIYNNPDYTFWAYSRWTYPDGAMVTSGLRYLDGSEDPDFDASDLEGTRASGIGTTVGTNDEPRCTLREGYYTLQGGYLGTEKGALARGLYIHVSAGKAAKVIL